MVNVAGFYTIEVIFTAKENIFSFLNEYQVKRRVTYEHQNLTVIIVNDIRTIIDKMEGNVSIPSFKAANYNSLPPSNLEPLAAVLCSLEDEIAALRREVAVKV